MGHEGWGYPSPHRCTSNLEVEPIELEIIHLQFHSQENGDGGGLQISLHLCKMLIISLVAVMPSSLGMLVYKALISKVTRNSCSKQEPGCLNWATLLRKCMLSLTKDRIKGTRGLKMRSTSAEIFPGMQPLPGMMGLPGGIPSVVLGLCILGLW